MRARDEAARLRALRELNLLDTAPSESFDRITRLASQLFRAPVASVALTDKNRLWFKSRVGIDYDEFPRARTPVSEIVATRKSLAVPDLTADGRFPELVKRGFRFHAGAPLLTTEGFCLGAMCVLDCQPRNISPEEAKALEDLAAMVMAQIELNYALGRIDPVSGMPNRNRLFEDLDDLARNRPGVRQVAVLLDLSDSLERRQMIRVLGHRFVEELLKSARDKVEAILGQKGGLYHIGVTQFVFLLDDLSEHALQAKIAEIHGRLRTFTFSTGIPVPTDAAIGITSFALGSVSARDVLRMAYAAAADARETEPKIATYSSSRDEEHTRRFMLLTALGEAIKSDGQLSLLYQPRIDLRSGACMGTEALLRWHHPILGDILPAEFIPVVEQTALIGPLTEWVIDAVLRQAGEWHASGLGLRVSINLSAGSLEDEDFARRFGERLRRAAVPPQAVELEFVEGALIRKQGPVFQQLHALRAMGCGIVIDEFGTGYSSFSYLQDIPATAIKIGRRFIRSLGGQQRDRTLVKAMISMLQDLGYRVVAEGVETQDVCDFLAACGCKEVQGHFISRPISAGALEEWLRGRSGGKDQTRRRTGRPAPARAAAAVVG